MSRLLIHGLDCEAISCLRAKHQVLWIADAAAADIRYLSVRDRCDLAPQGSSYKELAKAVRYVARKAPVIYECYSRHYYLRSINGRPVQDYHYLMVGHVEWACAVLLNFKPDLVVFANIPHEGYDNVLHEVAHFLGIKTVLLFQVPFGPKHWVLEGDRGVFGTLAPRLAAAESPPLNARVRDFVEQLDGKSKYFYMKNIRPVAVPDWKELFRSVLSARWKQAVAGALSAMQQVGYDTRLKKLTSKNHEKLEELEYGYFPLHLQPELTTSALGEGLYFDQVVAMRSFAKFCADNGLHMVVKDNPKQNFSHRSRYFFEAVEAIDNAIIVDRSVDSHELIRNSRIVATITGTAGLEALRQSKPVICYGDAWWRGFPGVFGADDMSPEILKTAIDPGHVVGYLGRMYGLAVDGCSDLDYSGVFGVEKSENSRLMAASVEALLLSRT